MAKIVLDKCCGNQEKVSGFGVCYSMTMGSPFCVNCSSFAADRLNTFTVSQPLCIPTFLKVYCIIYTSNDSNYTIFGNACLLKQR